MDMREDVRVGGSRGKSVEVGEVGESRSREVEKSRSREVEKSRSREVGKSGSREVGKSGNRGVVSKSQQELFKRVLKYRAREY